MTGIYFRVEQGDTTEKNKAGMVVYIQEQNCRYKVISSYYKDGKTWIKYSVI